MRFPFPSKAHQKPIRYRIEQASPCHEAQLRVCAVDGRLCEESGPHPDSQAEPRRRADGVSLDVRRTCGLCLSDSETKNGQE